MLYVISHNKIILLALLISVLSCKSRLDKSELKDITNSCTTSKDRLDCPFQIGVTHNTGGTCTQRFLNRLFNDTYQIGDGQERGFDLWEKEEFRVAPGTGRIKTFNVKLHIGVFKEVYLPEKAKWVYTMEPFQFQRDNRAEPENVVFEWELDTMGAPTNIRTFLILLKNGYFQSGKFSLNSQDAAGQTGAAWTNESELIERKYSDPTNFYGNFKKVLTYESAEFHQKLAAIQGQPDYSRKLLDLLRESMYSEDRDRCNRSKWLLDEQFAQIVSQEAENNQKFLYRNESHSAEDSFEELAARMFFRQFHFDFLKDIPFVGSEYTQDPFFTFSENAYWGFQQSRTNPITQETVQTEHGGNPHSFKFGDLIFLNNRSNENTYHRYIMASATKLAINPFLALSPDKKHVRPSNDLWQEKTGLPQPSVIGRFINRDGGYNKLIHFIKTAREMSNQKSLAYRLLDQKAKANIYAFAMEGTGADTKLIELEAKLAQTKDPNVMKQIQNEMTAITASTKLDMDVIRRIVDATRVANWNYGEVVTQNATEEVDIFSQIIAADNTSEIEMAKRNANPNDKAAFLAAYLNAIVSKRPSATNPVQDLRIMKVEIIPTGSYEINERNTYEIILDKGTFAPQFQEKVE